jgi:hypothetical protein
MPIIKKLARTALASLAAAMLLCGPANAKVSFCEGDSCGHILIINFADVIVTRVNITQEPGPNNCEKIKKTNEQNLLKNSSIVGEDRVEISVSKQCRYKIKFVTSKGCVGDKVGHVEPGQIKFDGRNVVALVNSCGTLKVKVTSQDPSAGM